MAVPQEEEFDIEKALKDFLTDTSRTEFQLPHMTTGQRKQAKKLADQYPEIKCESYGFGADRKLHFFKVDAVSPDAKGESRDSSGRSRTKSSERSTSASGTASPDSRPSIEGTGPAVSALDDAQENGPAPGMIRVRNTFIHVESTSLADERVVQSMPHGMFSRCWLEESKGSVNEVVETTPPPRIAVPPPAVEAPKEIFAAGAEVVIEGLTKCPAFNGLHGTVQSLDDETGRYNVLLASFDGSAGQSAKIKAENLRLLVPPPPPFESTAKHPAEIRFGSLDVPDFGAAQPEDFPSTVPAVAGLPPMPTTPDWQSQQVHQTCQLPTITSPHYDANAYDPYAFSMMYPAR